MSLFNLREYFFKDRPGDEPGKRAEVLITLALGFLVTGFWALAYTNPLVVILTLTTSLTALASLIQTVRGMKNFPLIFPSLVMISIILISILEGHGVHDLIWASALGVFLLVNIYSPKNNDLSVIGFGFMTLAAFMISGALETIGILPTSIATDWRYVFLNTALLAGIMGAITAIFHRHRSLMRAAKEIGQAQLEATQKIDEVNRSLEDQVRVRTKELQLLNEQLQFKTERLQAAADISRELMNTPQENIDDILSLATRLISQRLGYYHVGIFVLDVPRGFAILRAANSKGGQEMLARRHQLKIGGAGIVGYVAQSGRSRIALDTGADAVYFNNPYLPETRSELSLPIKVMNSVIGVLDVQSTQPAAFQEDDINPLMTISNQLAIILQQNENYSAGSVKSKQRNTQAFSWSKPEAYSFRPDGSIVTIKDPQPFVSTNEPNATDHSASVIQSEKGRPAVLTMPVKFRDQVIGVIHIETDDRNRAWTEAETQLVQSVSERAALALENARLFEAATRRAEQEETISRVTSQIGASTDFERIMQTTIQELGLVLGASRSFIQIGTPQDLNDEASE